METSAIKINVGSEFDAGGKKYKVLSVEDSITIGRMQAYEVIKMDYAYTISAGNIKDAAKKIDSILQGIILGKKQDENIFHVSMILQGINDALQKGDYPFMFSLMCCTLFIVKDGEDLSRWDRETAEAKIKDWQGANIDARCFFTLAVEWRKELNESLIQSMIEEENA